jgi:hypothetical protein
MSKLPMRNIGNDGKKPKCNVNTRTAMSVGWKLSINNVIAVARSASFPLVKEKPRESVSHVVQFCPSPIQK